MWCGSANVCLMRKAKTISQSAKWQRISRGDHFPGAVPVGITGNSPQPPTNPLYGDEPKTRSGSPTYPLDMLAAVTPDHKYLNLAVVNATDQEQRFALNVTGSPLSVPSKAWQLTGSSLEAANHVGQPAQLEIKQIEASSAQGTIAVAPISVTVYQFAVGR